MPFKSAEQFPSLQIPNLDGFVNATSGKSLTVRVEGDGKNSTGMCTEGVAQFPSRQIPNLDGIVLTATNKGLSITA